MTNQNNMIDKRMWKFQSLVNLWLLQWQNNLDEFRLIYLLQCEGLNINEYIYKLLTHACSAIQDSLAVVYSCLE